MSRQAASILLKCKHVNRVSGSTKARVVPFSWDGAETSHSKSNKNSSQTKGLISNSAVLNPLRDDMVLKCRRAFATITTDGPTASEEAEMTTAQLQLLAMKYVRQKNPARAQSILEKLYDSPTTTGGDTGSTDEELSLILASVIDSWLQFQTSKIEKLSESVAQKDLISLQYSYLEDILHAAESSTELLERASNSSNYHHILLAALRSWANVCEAARNASFQKVDWIRGIPQRAQHILNTQDADPSIEAVNQVLRAWAYSGEHLRGTMAEQLFQDCFSSTETTPNMSPTGDSYRFIMRAWCWSGERRSAFTATGHFMRMMRLLEFGQNEMEPTMQDYYTLFKAWTQAEDKTAPSKAYTVLEIAENVFQKGLTEVRPDMQCYRDALLTMSRRVNIPDVGELVDKTLLEMKKDRMMIPDTECYGSAIQAWKNVAMARECRDREGAIQRCYDLLQEMIKAFHRTTQVTVRPQTKHFNTVLEALASSTKSAKATRHAISLLDLMQRNENDDTDVAVPDADTYRQVLTVLQHGKAAEKLKKALQVLDQMKSRMERVRKSSSDVAIVQAFGAFITVCAHASSKDEQWNSNVFEAAMRTLEDLRHLQLEPDSSVYSALLEACDRLVPKQSSDRARVLETIFRRACEEGHVDPSVLSNFQAAASTFLYTKLVVVPSETLEQQHKVVPESWTRNVKGFQAPSKGGRKVLPLTIDGKFTFTRAAAEYKMRKLRRQTNKHMLQGGRMK